MKRLLFLYLDVFFLFFSRGKTRHVRSQIVKERTVGTDWDSNEFSTAEEGRWRSEHPPVPLASVPGWIPVTDAAFKSALCRGASVPAVLHR